jgi:hypothetical protein
MSALCQNRTHAPQQLRPLLGCSPHFTSTNLDPDRALRSNVQQPSTGNAKTDVTATVIDAIQVANA